MKRKIDTAGKTVEELRILTSKEPQQQTDCFDMFYDQIVLDDAINKKGGQK